MTTRQFVRNLSTEDRDALGKRLHNIQSGICYICQLPIDLQLHDGTLEFDHINPLAVDGRDTDMNLALTHAECNRNKGATDLRVARFLEELARLDSAARQDGAIGANLGHVLGKRGGAMASLRIRRHHSTVEFSFPESGDNGIHTAPLYNDKLSGLDYFFALVPIQYIHHDDVINPRSIGSNIRGLMEEFLRERPQLHVGLAWWKPDEHGQGQLKLFDGQHKAAAQIFLDARELPVRVFVDPPLDVLTQANTNAGSILRQVAFDKAVMRHLGSTLYGERVTQYQSVHGLGSDDYSFSERDLVNYFRAERRQIEKYIIDAQRDFITYEPSNDFFQYVERSGRGTDRPMSYATVDRSFFPFIYQKALDTPILDGEVRALERGQMTRLMNIFAKTFFVGQWDSDIGGRRIENRILQGETVPPMHLRAWRISRDEVAVNVLRWVRRVIDNFFAVYGRPVDDDRLLLEEFPERLWDNITIFLERLAELPCWVNPEMSSSVFGPKQNFDYWDSVFKTGKTPSGAEILPRGLQLLEMIAPN